MVWGCVSSLGVGPFYHIKGTMDQKKYLANLENIMLPHARCIHDRAFIYQDDIDPKH